MSRVAFVSRPSWGHVDFGGRSFLRTACELARRGHEVHWLLLRTQGWNEADALAVLVREHGVTLGWLDGPLNLARGVSVPALTRATRQLESFAVCAIDRAAVFASIAAHLAGVPWAAVGTNGQPWTRPRHFGAQPGRFQDPGVAAVYAQLTLSDYPDDARESCWLVSPYLNVSFFPRTYYVAGSGPAAHFVGAGTLSAETGRDVMVATPGTSLNATQQHRLMQLFHHAAATVAGRWRLLGDEPAASWQSYDLSFRDARLALGHGGNAFLWQAMYEGIPAVSLPSDTGDQTYAAATSARLEMGRWRPLHTATPEWIVGAVRELAESPTANARARRLRTVLGSGGGVAAAASLLARLAEDRTAATSCVEGPCCCVEPAHA